MFRSLLLVALSLASFSSAAQQSGGDWLAGTTWVLCETAQQEGVKRDVMVFEADGGGQLIRPEGTLAFRHQRNGDTVALSTPTSRHPVQLVATAARDMLLLRGPDGSAVASYARQGSAAMAACRIK